jgi:transcriptional regulator with XRE-family HTH domain
LNQKSSQIIPDYTQFRDVENKAFRSRLLCYPQFGQKPFLGYSKTGYIVEQILAGALAMTKSIFSKQYDQLRQLLITTRQEKRLTQAQVAKKLDKPQSFVSKYERGERRLDVIEFLQVTRALSVDPNLMIEKIKADEPVENILDKWEINPYNFTTLLEQNPSLRDMLFGYVAEFKLEELWLQPPNITACFKEDDHDRKRKGDRVIVYKDEQFIIEAKSLQTNTIAYESGRWIAKSQVDASDRREISLPDGTTLSTTCLLVGEFDVLAVNVYPFEEKWHFVFAKNRDLPRTKWRQYASTQREYLLATTVTVTWPPEPPFYNSLFTILDELIEERYQERID